MDSLVKDMLFPFKTVKVVHPVSRQLKSADWGEINTNVFHIPGLRKKTDISVAAVGLLTIIK